MAHDEYDPSAELKHYNSPEAKKDLELAIYLAKHDAQVIKEAIEAYERNRLVSPCPSCGYHPANVFLNVPKAVQPGPGISGSQTMYPSTGPGPGWAGGYGPQGFHGSSSAHTTSANSVGGSVRGLGSAG